MQEVIVKQPSAIILPDSKTVQQFKPRRWKSVKFTMAVRNDRKPMAGMVQTVVGRALGERADGQCFWVGIVIPWVVKSGYNWQKDAKKRLDTFLGSDCTCKVSGSEVQYCSYHLQQLTEWHFEDERVNDETRDDANQELLTQPLPGPLMERRIVHRDFPWVKRDIKADAIVCEICNVVENPYPDNSSWRNVFIQKHSACGFPTENYYKSMRETSLLYFSDVAAGLRKRRRDIGEDAMELEVLLNYCENRQSDSLPEKMSLDEAVEYLRKNCLSEGVRQPRLRGAIG